MNYVIEGQDALMNGKGEARPLNTGDTTKSHVATVSSSLCCCIANMWLGYNNTNLLLRDSCAPSI